MFEFDLVFKGVCVCLVNLEKVPKKCAVPSCQFHRIAKLMLLKKRPTKTKFMKAMIFANHFTAEEVKTCVKLIYPRNKKQTLANSLSTVMSTILKEGYIVFKDTKGVYKVRKRELLNAGT